MSNDDVTTPHESLEQECNDENTNDVILEAVLGHGSNERQGEQGECSSLPGECSRLFNFDDSALPQHDSDPGVMDPGVAEQHQESEEEDAAFAVGDHVYMWCSLAGIPGMFQHHGIVMQSMNGQITIADFNGMMSGSTNKEEDEDQPGTKKTLFPSSRSERCMREYTIEESQEGTKWKKVRYKAGWLRRSLWRSGTCTSAESDPPGLVLARVQFLLENQQHLPPYHVLKANCECVAVWCKTGTWATLQASSFLELTAAGQVKSATTLALYASSQTVTVPAAGVWGWLGYSTKVSLLSTQPLLLPVLAGYGIVSIGGPVWMLHRCKAAWNETTTKLNDEFWANAMDRPDVFVDCITHWSSF